MNIKMRLVSNNIGVEILKWSFYEWQLIIRTNCLRRDILKTAKNKLVWLNFSQELQRISSENKTNS